MIGIWQPELMESTDGLPLATKISDLVTNFPYDRLPSNPLLQLVLRPEGVVFLLGLYWLSKPVLARLAKKIDPKAPWFVYAVAFHNLSLAVFSLVVAINSWPILAHHYQRYGAMATYCDPHGTLWTTEGFGAWTVIFYLSKFWEFVDTWILVLKGKTPSLLQVYHHTGIVVCMWIGICSQSSWLVPLVLQNSIIHTLMYAYFFVKTLSPKTKIPVARYLTQAQIGQFLTGIGYSAGVLVLGDSCDSQSSRFGLALSQAYVFGLIALFLAFFAKKYKK